MIILLASPPAQQRYIRIKNNWQTVWFYSNLLRNSVNSRARDKAEERQCNS
ncbi:hypothetical protein NVIE_0920 [Nitrososphaera viennensis EN76]|uniref:Uncharacterized protein n=1 Tax=Nitrososphaera viennensis EN76 TaxID=926571 RepID=A0A060HIH8_9ARCH|nr:hypothetical protein NVIE_0920 [Nitrososphaera viennensis EN76]